MGRILKYTLAGALGATIAWACMEPTSLMPNDLSPLSSGQIAFIGMIVGLLVGLALGIAEASSGLTFKDARRAIGLGALFGAGGGLLGLTIGAWVYGIVSNLAGGPVGGSHLPANVPPQAAGGVSSGPTFLSFLLLLLGRALGWALIGTFIGISQGIATLSPKKMLNGAIGGFLGGGAGGALFEILAWINQLPGVNIPTPVVRFIAFAITGGAIGLFMACAEELAKQAWLVRLVGNNEGRTIDLYSQRMVIGRSEYADVPVFGDPDIGDQHALITMEGKAFAIQDLGTPFGTNLNGARISHKEYLRDGDTIILGKTKFLFRDKATARSYGGSSAAPAGVQIPTSQHVCPFCGSIKDAAGNCDCSVGAVPSVPPTPLAGAPVSSPTVVQPANAQASSPFNAPAQPLNGGAQGAGPRLIGVSGPYAGQVFQLKSGQTQIGRDASQDVALPMDTTVSRSHARIAQEVTAYVLYDSGSTNGTYVGGAKIQRQELRPGDVMQVGNTKFRFEQ